MQQLSGLATQRGASVTSIVLTIILLGVAIKLMIAIIPAQIGDYQLTKTLSSQLREANNNNETTKQFIERIDKQLSINADYDSKAEDVIIFTDKKAGQLAIRKQYAVTNNFFGNVDILNRFEGDIDMATTK